MKADRLRVGLFCDAQQRNGMVTYSCQLARGLRAQDVHVRLFTLRPRSTETASVLDELRAAADETYLLPAAPEPAGLAAEIARGLRRYPVEVFVPNYRWLTYAACARVSRERDLRIVGVCHSDDPSYYNLLRYYRDLIHGYVCPARKSFDTLRDLLPGRAADIRFIPHGVPLPETRPVRYDGGPLKLLYHGRLEEVQKNVSALIELARRLRDRGVAFKLRLAGKGNCTGQYQALVEQGRLAGCVEFVGECDQEGLSRLFRGSHLAVLTSHYEGFCLSLAEAMAAGLPGIAFTCGGVIEEYLHDGVNGFLVPSGAVDSMADRVEWFAKHPERWQAFSAAAQSAIRTRYSLEAFGEQYAAYFRELAAAGPRRQWPRLRPWILPPGKRSWPSIVERVGCLVGAWE